MVSFEIFVKAMPPTLSELKVLPSVCFAFKIPDNVAVTIAYCYKLKGFISIKEECEIKNEFKLCSISTIEIVVAYLKENFHIYQDY